MSSSSSSARFQRHYRTLLQWIPLSLHPKILSLKNRYLNRGRLGLTDLCAFCMTTLLMVGLYYGTRNTLREVTRSTLHNNIGEYFLSGFSLGLFALIFLSAAVTGLSNLFMARDIDMLRASPIPDTSFLRGKAIEVLISTTWMIVVFSLPPYIAFGQHFGAAAPFFSLAPIFVGLFLLLAVLLGMTVSIVCAAILPARTGRNIFVALFVIVLGVVLALINATPDTGVYTQLLNGTTQTTTLRILIHHPTLPSTWLADILLSLTTKPDKLRPYPIIALCTALPAAWLILVTSFRLLYSQGYSRLHSQPRAYSLISASGKTRRWLVRPKALQATRALATRELFSFGRDITHTIQLALFLTICILYFINFQSISTPTHVGTWMLRAWDLLAITSFITLSSLIILSICARFVFPSVSLEGASLWILQVAPVTPHFILRTKYLTWALPLGFVYALLLGSAGLALALEPLCIVMLGLSACIMTHGLVALGIGLGARFSRFDWEHPAELATSWGNLLFLLAGIITLGINFIPLCLTFGCYLFFPSMFQTTGNIVTLFAAGLGTLLLINLIIGKVALKIGGAALTRVFVG